jgi:hypothetical protein
MHTTDLYHVYVYILSNIYFFLSSHSTQQTREVTY